MEGLAREYGRIEGGWKYGRQGKLQKFKADLNFERSGGSCMQSVKAKH
jgi:hypothetical protein